jgi:hypothetical protein
MCFSAEGSTVRADKCTRNPDVVWVMVVRRAYVSGVNLGAGGVFSFRAT